MQTDPVFPILSLPPSYKAEFLLLLPKPKKINSMNTNQMTKFLTFTCLMGACALSGGLTGCQTTTTANNSATATSQKEMLLTQAGFKPMTVTTPKQQEHLAKLAVDKVSAVKNQGKLYYVYPTAKKDHILIGRQAQFDSYKKMLQTQMAQPQQAMTEEQRERQNEPGGVYNVRETAGPNRIIVEDFDGFGPIQDNPIWQ
jgi:hypothetical protein